MDAAFCTIIAKNYLAYARVLGRTLRQHHPGVPFYVLLVDEPEGFFDPAAEPFQVLRRQDVDLPRPPEFCFRYDVLELSTAVKPYFLERLFARGHDRIVFLDPDVRVYRPLAMLLDERERWRMVLTPHLIEPLEDGKRPGEREILLSGVYNLGFLALSRDAGVDAFLGWWKDRCEHDCVVDPSRGLFVDQRWMDLVPGMMDGVRILRDPTYNLAYWNLAHRRLEGTPEAPLVNGSPLHFLHFSGLDPLHPTLLSRHQDRYETVTEEPLLTLLQRYSAELLEQEHRICSRWPYTHARFDDGHPVPRVMRELFREQPPGRFPDPFQGGGPGTYVDWAVAPSRESTLSPLGERLYRWWQRAEPNGHSRSASLAPLAAWILSRRSDVRARCTTAAGSLDRQRFLEWLASEGAASHQIRPAWCQRWLADARGSAATDRLLAAYDASPELRKRYPMAFVDEHDAPAFRAWVEANADTLGIDAGTLDALRHVFADEPTRRISEIYWSRPDVQRAFPQALGWPGDPAFLAWLRHSGRDEYGISEEWVSWFARARAQHVCRRIHQLYFSRPDWQERHPQAFSPFGRRDFLEWLRNEGPAVGLDLSSLKSVCPPRAYSALDELRSLHRHEAEVRERFPHAFRRVAETERLLAWLHDEGRRRYDLDGDWLERLGREARAQGIVSRGALVVGYLRTESGMGELARATVRALGSVRYPVATRDLDEAPQRKADATVLLDDASDPLPFTIVHVNGPEAVRLRGRLPRRGASGQRIACWAWELPSLPPEWSDAFALFDEVWTCSRYSAAAIGGASPIPVQTFWPALPEAAPARVERADLGLDPAAFTFLFMYDLFSETDRKNPVGLVEAFREAFRADDRVRLVIKTSNGDLHRDDLRRVVDAARDAPVTVMDRYLTRPEVLGLMQACDAYVSLHRCEGFGLTLAEAMSLGKPVVATYYSGNVDFMSPWNCFPVPYRLVPIQQQRGPYAKGQLWAEPDTGAAAALMRKIVREPELALEVAARGRADVLRQLSARACGERITERLAVLAAASGPQVDAALEARP
jgi:glycosyltransferase involved in cell wall biosynthesis